MSYVDTSRWTCPDCHRTIVIDGTPADVACCIKAAQTRHARAHKAADLVVRRIGLAGKKPRRGAA